MRNIKTTWARLIASLVLAAIATAPLLFTAPTQAVTIMISPTSGPVGTTVTVTGAVDGNGNSYDVLWDNVVVQNGTAAASSVIVSTAITVPVTNGGTHTVALRDALTLNSVSTTFTVTPTITITPTSGTVGTTITMNGTGFDNGETGISITYNANTIKSNISADTTGSWSTTFNIPDSPSGATHVVGVSRTATGATAPTSQNLTVVPSFTVTPTSGTISTSITVTGKGFAASETITITIDDESAKTGIATDTNGSWLSTFAFPDSPGGVHNIGVYGSTTSTGTVTDKTFTVSPGITVTPSTGTVGTQVTVTGTGFGAGETGIVVTFNAMSVSSGITASTKGRWTTTFQVPSGAGGAHSISAYGNTTPASGLATATFGIVARITVNPASGVVGDTVNVTGQSFGANETGISILYDGSPVASNLTASATGDWTATFTIPPSTTGNHRIGASGAFTAAASVPEQGFSVTPKLSITPATGAVGTQITITGTGFAAARPVTISYDNQPVTPTSGTAQSTAQGNITATLNAPKSKGGVHKITVSDGTSQRDSDWTMENTPPPLPALSKPSNGELIGWFGDDPVTFKWSEVQDPSGVSYTLHVSTDASFSTLAIKQEGLTKPEFTSGPLPLGAYHWRVKAIDGADNASDWTPVMSVRVGIMPLWAFIAIAALVFAILGAVIFLLVGRKGRSVPRAKREKLPKAKPRRISEPELEAELRPVEEAEEVSEGEPEPTPPPPPPPRAVPKTPAKAVPPHTTAPQPSPAPSPQPEIEPDQAETEEIVIKAVSGLTDTDISLLAQREDLRQRGLTLAKLYRICSRLEREGRLVRDRNDRYQPSGIPAGGKPTPPEPPLAKAPVPPHEGIVAEEPTRPPSKPKPVARPAPSVESPPGLVKKAPPPEEPSLPPPQADTLDPETEQLVADSVIGMSDADITQVAQSELIRSRGLTLARVYKIVGRLEKGGQLVRDDNGRYQKAAGKAIPKPPAKEETFPTWEKPGAEENEAIETVGLEDYRPLEKPPTAKETKPQLKPAGTTEEIFDVVIEAIVNQTDADIPQIAQQPELRSRGLNLAKIYQITSRLEKDGRIIRDDAGYYRRATGKPEKTEPPKRFTTIEWTGKLPWQQWSQFYAQVLSAYLTEDVLSIDVYFKVGPEASISSEKLEETRAALRELKLSDEMTAERRADAPARLSRVERSGNLPWQSWEAFFAKVLSRFLSETTLSISVSVKAVSKAGFNQARVDGTTAALKGLALTPDLKVS
ncbi:MAG: IPT/TIG domain-containing protein [Chloroflexota bacterium]